MDLYHGGIAFALTGAECVVAQFNAQIREGIFHYSIRDLLIAAAGILQSQCLRKLTVRFV